MKNKFLSYLFTALAILLSNVMCAAVAYNYCDIQWGIRYAGSCIDHLIIGASGTAYFAICRVVVVRRSYGYASLLRLAG